MEKASGNHAVRQKNRCGTFKMFLAAVVCSGLMFAGLPFIDGGSAGLVVGPQTACAQQMVEPFEGSGPIYEIHENGMIDIGDTIFHLADVVRFYRTFTKEEEISPTWFTVGKQVGFTVNQFGEIDEMWLE